MGNRYQLFISPSYTDLVEKRSEVIQTLLELECLPSGIELFSASLLFGRIFFAAKLQKKPGFAGVPSRHCVP
jgi:hypothetical protein